MTSDASRASKPVHTIRRGVLQVKIWEHAGEKGPWYSATPIRRYKQGEEWKDATSFNADDLLTLGKMIDQADTWIAEKEQADRKATATPALEQA